MDARERLRRYLEQRRELGESEFVLDALSVDEVLQRLGVGASRGGRPPAGAPHQPSVTPPASAVPAAPPAMAPPAMEPPPVAPRVVSPVGDGGDWRLTLGGAGAAGGDRAATGGGDEAWPAWIGAVGVPRGVARPAPPLPESVAALASLGDVARAVAACTGCALHRSARNPVPGKGPPQAELLCVGEAPGADEDAAGEPFVGEAGKLLTKILAAINLSRDAVFIGNVLKHRPPGNRDPQPDEMQPCLPFLWRQVALVRPRVILALGRVAAQAITGSSQGIGALRGRVHLFMGIPVVATYHPAALLRNEEWKRPTWEDVKVAQRLLQAARAHDGGASPHPGAEP